jgi:hypothetical protein
LPENARWIPEHQLLWNNIGYSKSSKAVDNPKRSSVSTLGRLWTSIWVSGRKILRDLPDEWKKCFGQTMFALGDVLRVRTTAFAEIGKEMPQL